MVQHRSQRGSIYYISFEDKTCVVCFQHFTWKDEIQCGHPKPPGIEDSRNDISSSKDRVIYNYRKADFEQMRNHISEQKHIDNIPGKCTEETWEMISECILDSVDLNVSKMNLNNKEKKQNKTKTLYQQNINYKNRCKKKCIQKLAQKFDDIDLSYQEYAKARNQA